MSKQPLAKAHAGHQDLNTGNATAAAASLPIPTQANKNLSGAKNGDVLQSH